MSESLIQLPPDSSGKNLRSLSQSISGTTVQNQVIAFATNPTYIVNAEDITVASGATMVSLWHVSGSPTVAIKGCYITNTSLGVQSGQVIHFDAVRPSAAPTGGTDQSAVLNDPITPASGVRLTIQKRPTNVFSGQNRFFTWVTNTQSPGSVGLGAFTSGTATPQLQNMIQQTVNILPQSPEWREIKVRSGTGFAIQQKVSGIAGTAYTQVTSGQFNVTLVYTVEF